MISAVWHVKCNRTQLPYFFFFFFFHCSFCCTYYSRLSFIFLWKIHRHRIRYVRAIQYKLLNVVSNAHSFSVLPSTLDAAYVSHGYYSKVVFILLWASDYVANLGVLRTGSSCLHALPKPLGQALSHYHTLNRERDFGMQLCTLGITVLRDWLSLVLVLTTTLVITSFD